MVDTVLSEIERIAKDLVEAGDIPRWVVLPKWMVGPRHKRSGKLVKRRLQKKLVPLPMILKGTRWFRV